ncbi:hypothetical protein K3M67_02915 [Sphingobium sp. V4]|jgi:apolipoprotein N-acyltransferase|uniref:hypothetical protein n=1 Tax=Sphingobium sp. V4 TaxID=3038927 RepID=UPI002557FEF5|nr:hypothetical protein [Sphingobium sp. V4]WIW88947.1 hypothetical protein K3M67_02915 [Sphingobium sp. V4]
MNTEPFSAIAYTIMAALAGAVTALAFRPWKKMTGMEIGLTLFVGFSFAIFVSPWVAHSIIKVPAAEPRAASFITYIMGAGSNILLPRLIQLIERLLGTKGDGQ